MGSACKVQEEIMMKWTTGNGFVSYYRRKLRGPSGFKGNKEVRLRSSSSGARQNRVWVLPILWYLSHQSGDSQCGPPLRYPPIQPHPRLPASLHYAPRAQKQSQKTCSGVHQQMCHLTGSHSPALCFPPGAKGRAVPVPCRVCFLRLSHTPIHVRTSCLQFSSLSSTSSISPSLLQ